MKRAIIEKMDNGYLLTLEFDKSDRPPTKWVENKLKKIFAHIQFFFVEGKEILSREIK